MTKPKNTNNKEDSIPNSSDYYNQRLSFVKTQPSPATLYPHKFYQTVPLSKFVETYSALEKDERLPVTHSLCGRVMSKRGHGSLYFYDLVSDGTSVQLMCTTDVFEVSPYASEAVYAQSFAALHAAVQRGDIVGASGAPCRSTRGQLSLAVRQLTVLAPCLRLLPTAHFGLADVEQRFRNRALDLLVNKGVRETFLLRCKTIAFLRRSLAELDFLEVETPVLDKVAAGAAARAFATELNEHKLPLFLRIATELPLKKLVVGGFERVFELGRVFRNEGVDATHNPEFTSLELYWAFRDYREGLEFTEGLLAALVRHLFGDSKVSLPDGRVLDFTPPFRRVSFLDEIAARAGFAMPTDLESEAARLLLLEQVNAHRLAVPSPPTVAKLLDKLAGKFVEESAFQPTFVLDHPLLMSPLAKFHRTKSGVAERFELFVNGFEVANAYTELNNPLVQREAFAAQAKQKAAGDDEVPEVDEGFLQAMELGLQPTFGLGIGIDRLVMLLTGKESIKEVILFPLLRDKK